MSFDTVVGLEVHVQLSTKSKAFCGDDNFTTSSPNTHISPISLAYPGTLPRINAQQVHFAIRLGLALESQIALINKFDRKNYFYPDLPKGYQITQDGMPICVGGHFSYETEGQHKTIRIHHIHMEEDAGKSIHGEEDTLLDYNRAGTPLLEVVTEPDFNSGQEVSDFMAQFQILLRFLDISDANMEEGSLRCDCNVSVKPSGQSALGTRCEIKNLNSKRFAKMAIEIESARQIKAITAGQTITQESRLFDPAAGRTYGMRKKEDALDYRYFPDPDLQFLEIDAAYVASIKREMGMMPWELQSVLTDRYGVSKQHAGLIAQQKSDFRLFEQLSSRVKDHKLVSNFIVNQLLPMANEMPHYQSDTYIEKWTELLNLIKSDRLSASIAYQRLLPQVIAHPESSVTALAEAQDLILAQSDTDYSALCHDILAANPEKVDIFRKGKKGLMGFFIGEAMKSGIKGINPKSLQAEFEKLLHEN